MGTELPGTRCPDFANILRSTPPSARLMDQIVTCFSAEMGRIANYRCRDQQLAEDTLQDSIVSLLENLPTFRGDAPLKAWLFKLVTSACSRLRRGRKNDPRFNLPLDETAEENDIAPEQPMQEMQLLMQERFEILNEVLTDVEEPNRQMLLLHEGQDLSVAELAERFDMSPDAIKSRLKRTRAQVRERLLKKAEEPIAH
jgi:RNA polymerase sigma-70 factor (ECF subfamily)